MKFNCILVYIRCGGAGLNMMQDLPVHFERFKRAYQIFGWDQGHDTLTINRIGLVNLFQTMLTDVYVDEEWYRWAYPDVAEALAEGKFANCRQHYVMHGYFEGRIPTDKVFDHEFYIRSYPDVAARVGKDRNALLAHFVNHGYAEGRSGRPQGSQAPKA